MVYADIGAQIVITAVTKSDEMSFFITTSCGLNEYPSVIIALSAVYNEWRKNHLRVGK